MKVYVGPYIYRWVSNVHQNYMNKKYGRYEWHENETKFEQQLEKIEDFLQFIYDNSINIILDRRKRKIKVRIDRYDSWSADHTLSLIILPLIKDLKENMDGAPYVDDSDVPDHLKSTSAPPKENVWDTDDFHFDRWDWVLDEIIWSFEQKVRDDWESDYYKYEDVKPDPTSEDFSAKIGFKLTNLDNEGRKKHQERMSNGFRLFGKYYEGLWT